MDLIDRLKDLSSRIPKIADQLQTEEATKNALIMPFIASLGYDVFNPIEVVPEFTADVGTKKGEKVDYAIMRDGKPIMLFECKACGTDLEKEHASQLYRYFSVTDARFGVLTDGVKYKFYSDLEQPNKMDSRPFLELNILALTSAGVDELKKFAKELFDLENILSTASELKYTKGIKRVLGEEWVNPSEELIRILASRVYSGRITQAAKEQFTTIIKKVFHEFVADRVNMRLKSAMESEPSSAATASEETQGEAPAEEAAEERGKIVTTDEEIEGFYVVKSIVRDVVDASRIYMRDTQTYCGVLLDDNNRKPICRLFFNGPTPYLGILDENKQVTRHKIDGLNDIYKFADELKATVQRYASD